MLRGGNEAKGAGRTHLPMCSPRSIASALRLQFHVEVLRSVFKDRADPCRVERVPDGAAASLCWGEVTVDESEVFEVSEHPGERGCLDSGLLSDRR